MPWGFVAAAGVGAVGSIIAGGEQASGQEAAANTQAGMFNTVVQQEQPFIQGGYGAEQTLNQMMSPGGYLTQQFNPTEAQVANYPGYQFQRDQGALALQSEMSPGIGAVSGPALKSLMGYNQGLAASNYQNYFNQYQTQQNNIFNRLAQIATIGQNAAGNLGSNSATLGTGIAQAQAASAGSIAGGIVGATNSASNGLALNYLMANNNNNSWMQGYGGGSPAQGQTGPGE